MQQDLDKRMKRWVRTAIEDSLAKLEDRNSLDDIIASCAVGFNVMPSDILGGSRWWIDVAARQVAMVLATRFLRVSGAAIARHLHKDHTSIIFACRSYDDLIDDVFAAFKIVAPRRRSGKPQLAPYAGALKLRTAEQKQFDDEPQRQGRGHPTSFSPEQLLKARALLADGVPVREVAKQIHLTRQTVYRIKDNPAVCDQMIEELNEPVAA